MMIFFGLPVRAVHAEEIRLERAIALAQERTRDVVRAEVDVLLVDVEYTRALATVLPRFDLYTTARELFYGDVIFEQRVPILQPNAAFTSGGEFAARQRIGPFQDFPQDSFSHPNFFLSLAGRQLLFDGGRWWTVLSRVDDIREARESVLKMIRNNVRLWAVRQFYNCAKAREAVRATAFQAEMSADQLRRVESNPQEGLAKDSELATAKRNLAADLVALERRKFAEDSAKRELNLAMGRDPDTPIEIVLPPHVQSATIGIAILELPATDQLQALAMSGRPELQRAKAELEILKKNVSIRSGERWPTISLGAAYTRTSRRPARVFFDNPAENYSALAGIDVHWNIFDGGTKSANIEEAELELKKSIVSYEDLQRFISAEVSDRTQNLKLLYGVYRLVLDGAATAEKAVQLAKELYRNERATALELRDSELRLTQAKLAVYEARFDVEVALEEVRRAVGDQSLFGLAN